MSLRHGTLARARDDGAAMMTDAVYLGFLFLFILINLNGACCVFSRRGTGIEWSGVHARECGIM